MKLKLTDFQSNTYEDTDGSCELCMWTGMLDHPTYEFTDSNGGVHVVDGWYSDWGHHTTIDINVPVFTHWLHGVEFKEIHAVAEQLYIGPYRASASGKSTCAKSSTRQPTVATSRNLTTTSPGRFWMFPQAASRAGDRRDQPGPASKSAPNAHCQRSVRSLVSAQANGAWTTKPPLPKTRKLTRVRNA